MMPSDDYCSRCLLFSDHVCWQCQNYNLFADNSGDAQFIFDTLLSGGTPSVDALFEDEVFEDEVFEDAAPMTTGEILLEGVGMLLVVVGIGLIYALVSLF